jgi:phage terminase large subunit-like protein
VQHSFYDDEVSKARKEGPEKLADVISKDFNMYRGTSRKKWIKPDRIRQLQVDKHIEDCKYSDGWSVFCGLDFSHGDDLFAITYLGVNYTPGSAMLGRFFADCDAWILEKTMQESPLFEMYEKWVEQGWLHVCPGEVFDCSLAIDSIARKTQEGVNITAFGYDPAQSMQPINQLKAWLQTIFQGRGVDAKDMANTIEQMVRGVGQSAMVQNPRILELEHMILEAEPWIQFSANPMWPWQFGNCMAELNTISDLRRLMKGGPRATHKIDNVAALEDALYLFDMREGRISE